MSASANHSEVELTSSSTATSNLSSIQPTIPDPSAPPPLLPKTQGNLTVTEHASVTSIFTEIPTNSVRTTTFTQMNNTIYISTTIQSPVPDPTTTAASAVASLDNNTSLTHTALGLCIALAILAFVLLAALLILLFIYIQRRRRRRPHDDDNSPPLTSLGPEPTPAPGFSTQSVPVLPVHVCTTSLSMGPRMGTLDPYSISESQMRRNENFELLSDPVGVDEESREISNFPRTFSSPPDPGASPVSPIERPRLSRFFSTLSAPDLPDLPSLIPPLPTSPTSSSPSQTQRAPSPTLSPVSSLIPSPPMPRYPTTKVQDFADMTMALQRKPSLPLYHKALQEQATHQRERAGAEQAGRLGLPVITFETGRGSIGTDMSFEVGEEGFIPERIVEGAGARVEGKLGNESEREIGDGMRDRVRGQEVVIHNSRASSGVFPERRDDERDSEAEINWSGKEKDV